MGLVHQASRGVVMAVPSDVVCVFAERLATAAAGAAGISEGVSAHCGR